MTCQPNNAAHLAMLVRRLLDADLLTDLQANTLLAEADAAFQLSEQGEDRFAQRHVERVALFTQALVKTEGLTLAEGRAVIKAADDILESAVLTNSPIANSGRTEP